jgi:hypothetical protein
VSFHVIARSESDITFRFGTVALILQLIPPFSMLFLMTTAAGSALWVTDIERKRRAANQQASRLGEQYRDDIMP